MLEDHAEAGRGPRDAGTYNSVNRLCFRKDSRAGGDDSGGDMMG